MRYSSVHLAHINREWCEQMAEVTTLRDETRELLLNRPASLSVGEIAEAIGVSKSWLNAFARGGIDNPGVVTIETLNAFLKKFSKAKK